MKRKSGAKLSRSEIVTVRLDPKLRYLAELASRKLRRTVSSFIEWSVEKSLQDVTVGQGNEYAETIFEKSSLLWDVNEADRLVVLAQNYPHLLNHQEQLLWKLIHDFSIYNPTTKRLSRFYDENQPHLPLIRACWVELKAAIEGGGAVEALKKAICIHDDTPF